MTARMTHPLRSTLVRAAAVSIAIAVMSSKSGPVEATGALYTVTDLGSLGCCPDSNLASLAYGINNDGIIVGATPSPGDPNMIVPFIYRNGVMTQIGNAGGWATAINDAAQVTGSVFVEGGTSISAFLYHEGVFTELDGLPSNLPASVGWAINNTGTIVGQSKGEAMIYENGVMSGLKRRTAYVAYGVNDAGDVVGELENVSPLARAFLFSGNNLIDLGTMDGDPNSVTVATGINRLQQIVGYGWNTNSMQRGFLYENGVMKDIGTLAGGYAAATAINNVGEIVGYSDGSAFVYRNGSMIDLNGAIDKDAGGIWPKISSVLAINDHGAIVGSCYLADAQGNVRIRACLLTPIAPAQ